MEIVTPTHFRFCLEVSKELIRLPSPVKRWLLSTVAHIQLCCVVLCVWTLLLRCACHYVHLSGESIRCHDMVEYLLGSSSPSPLPSPPLPPPTHSPHVLFLPCRPEPQCAECLALPGPPERLLQQAHCYPRLPAPQEPAGMY